MVSDTVPTVVNNYPYYVSNSSNVSGIVCKKTASKRPQSLSNEVVPYLTFTRKSLYLIRHPMVESQINAKEGNSISEKYPTTTTKMTGESNESPEHGQSKKEEQSSRDEEAVTKVEDNTPVVEANTKRKRGKDDSKSDSSEPIDDDSENTCSNVACARCPAQVKSTKKIN
jgi:hypothetical protein